jgi:hypothetical protein
MAALPNIIGQLLADVVRLVILRFRRRESDPVHFTSENAVKKLAKSEFTPVLPPA